MEALGCQEKVLPYEKAEQWQKCVQVENLCQSLLQREQYQEAFLVGVSTGNIAFSNCVCLETRISGRNIQRTGEKNFL